MFDRTLGLNGLESPVMLKWSFALVNRFGKPVCSLSSNDDARCCICLKSYRIAGPFVEIQSGVCLCEACILACQQVLADDKARRKKLRSKTQVDATFADEPDEMWKWL